MHSLLVLSVKNQKKKKKRIASCTLSTASAERSFSQLSRIKSYCRSTMKQNRLNGLAAAYIHKDLDINPDETVKLYTQMHHRRLDFGVNLKYKCYK